MSKLVEFRGIERQLKDLQHQLEDMEQSEALQRDLEFVEMLEVLMEEHKKSAADVIRILVPEQSEQAAPRVRRKRLVKVYVNPHSGEQIETKGGNHKGLKAWKDEFGADVVESWVQQ